MEGWDLVFRLVRYWWKRTKGRLWLRVKGPEGSGVCHHPSADDSPDGQPVGPQAEAAGVSLDGLEVLVVEDNADTLEVITTALVTAYGAHVKTALSAVEALGILRSFWPNVLTRTSPCRRMTATV